MFPNLRATKWILNKFKYYSYFSSGYEDMSPWGLKRETKIHSISEQNSRIYKNTSTN